jgi:hypothetical protein
MFRRRVKYALFVDFDNVSRYVPPSKIVSWLSWLEDGHFADDGRKRTFLEKRIYWNSAHEIHREAFEEADFDVVLTCPPLFGPGII